MPLHTPEEPFELVEDIASTELGGYSILQLGIGAGVVLGAIYLLRKGYEKAIGKA